MVKKDNRGMCCKCSKKGDIQINWWKPDAGEWYCSKHYGERPYEWDTDEPKDEDKTPEQVITAFLCKDLTNWIKLSMKEAKELTELLREKGMLNE